MESLHHEGGDSVVHAASPSREDKDTDWRLPLIKYIREPGDTTDRKIRRQALKYTLLDDELCRRTVDGVLLKCLDAEAARSSC
jgi:hypothetical protein